MPDNENAIFSPAVLPSGRILHNRLVKVALYEHLAALFDGRPNRFHSELYSKWSTYDWGMIITGNVQVSPQHLCLARDLILPRELSEPNVRPFRNLAAAIHGQRAEKPLAIMQLNHSGRQSPNILGGRRPFASPLGPSSIRLGASLKQSGILSDLMHRLMFQVPRSMSLAEIDDVVAAFVRGAELAAQTGFDGVELHAAHGYLLAQFISPKSNARTDDYSCSLGNALRLLHRIVTETRAAVPGDFVLGIKINSADYAESYTAGDVSPALDHIRTIASWGLVDFIEISGGDYEKPDFLTYTSSPSSRQGLFADFAHHALRAVAVFPRAPLILLTGGLATPAQLRTALSSRHAHLLGLGRSAILRPDLPQLLTHIPPDSQQLPFAAAPDLGVGVGGGGGSWTRRQVAFAIEYLPRIKLLGAGAAMAWYVVALRRLAVANAGAGSVMRTPAPDYSIGALGGVWWMWAWFGPESPALTMVVVLGISVLAACVAAQVLLAG
ncbi:hypothetical protein DFH08DRAFT_507803 [Mycena albidolilacea]|uniref:NADH:flavin oxidoreductase/NADH oxidase N-terminal domain-containing protein n=1 Tax=Mycena albidolilacea TaxID=1033008 RepID=A0AAD7AEH3_9AGAR|nr:hypothetical protein DFH08DRAFT_507803 [Mycena albidolilacea]